MSAGVLRAKTVQKRSLCLWRELAKQAMAGCVILGNMASSGGRLRLLLPVPKLLMC